MEADKGIWKITKGKQNRIYINCSDESQVMRLSDPKKYAEDLVEKMRLSSLKMSKKDAVNCALIAVDEILNLETITNTVELMLVIQIIQKLNEWHIDYQNLISNNLAIDLTTTDLVGKKERL